MMCKNCGSELREGAKFCDECGSVVENDVIQNDAVTEEKPAENVTEEKSAEVTEQEPEKKEGTGVGAPPLAKVQQKDKKDKKVSIKTIGIAIAGIVAALVVIFVVIAVVIPFVSSLFNKPTPSSGSGSQGNTPQAHQNAGGSSSSADVQYIGDRRVQFNEEDGQYVVFFSLQDAQKNYMSAAGQASIVITDTTGNQLYNQTINFTEKDFTTWTNQSWDESRLMCGLYINKSDIAGSSSSTGVLTLTVTGETFSFSPDNLSIYDLPEKQLSISFPSTPYVVREYDWHDQVEFVLEVQDIYFETTSNYDGEISGKICVKVKMLTNNSDATSSYSHVSYKMKNSEGIVVDSGSILVTAVSEGEITIADTYISDLNPNDSYTVTLENTK